MTVKYVRQRGVIQTTPFIVRVYGSGTIYPGSVVEFHRTTNNNRVEPASSGTTYTNILGISLDYIQGASDALIKVVPFAQGQLWEVDCANIGNTNQLFIRHALTNSNTVNNSSTNVNAATGVFVAYAFAKTVYAGLSTSTFKLLGEFIRSPGSYSL